MDHAGLGPQPYADMRGKAQVRSACLSIDSRIQRFDISAGTATHGSLRPKSPFWTWQAKSQQLRDCQAQGSPIRGARNSLRERTAQKVPSSQLQTVWMSAVRPTTA